MKSNIPYFDLGLAKKLANDERLILSGSARDDIYQLGIDELQLRACLLGLIPDEFERSHPYQADSYLTEIRTQNGMKRIYLKFRIIERLNSTNWLLLSFHQRQF